MTEHGALPPDVEDVSDRMRDLAYLPTPPPRLSGEQVRRKGVRRRRVRHSLTAVGTGATAVAGVFVVVLLAAGHSPATVVPPAVGRSSSAPATRTPSPSTVIPTPAAIGTPGTTELPGHPGLPLSSASGPTAQVSAPATSIPVTSTTPSTTPSSTPSATPSPNPNSTASSG